MGRWSKQAVWVGPTGNQSGPMLQQRGMILHVMQGSLAGSVQWAKNPASSVSFHFGTSKSGLCQQLVDTDVTAWTQADGNGKWVSVENEDFSGNPLNAAQVENVAQLYARGVREYGWPYQLANSPSGRGLGYHAMGGVAWGNHPDCPGQPIIDQRGLILARAEQINGGAPPEGVTGMSYKVRDSNGSIYWCPGGLAPSGKIAAFAIYGSEYDAFPQVQLPGLISADAKYDTEPQPWPTGGSGGGATPAQVSAAVRAELDATKLAGA